MIKSSTLFLFFRCCDFSERIASNRIKQSDGMRKTVVDKEFMSMIREYEGVIYKVASFYTDQENPISDLYQEIVINLWRGFSSFRGDSKYSTWIYRISLNTCISILRRTKNKPGFVDLSIDIPHLEDSRSENLKELYAIINRLEKIERALVLLYLDDKSYKEIAEITGLSESNVATKLHRTKEKMKKMTTK